MTYSLDLDFVKPKKTDLPGPPRAHISVKSHTRDESGLIFITPECVTFEELDSQINRLQQELENIRKQAKEEFRSLSKKGPA